MTPTPPSPSRPAQGGYPEDQAVSPKAAHQAVPRQAKPDFAAKGAPRDSQNPTSNTTNPAPND